MSGIQTLDCTLRDGGYLNDWEFGNKMIRQTIRQLVASNVDFVELGCNTGIRTALLNCGLKNVLLEDTIREIAESTAEYLGLDVEYGEWEEEERGGRRGKVVGGWRS